MIPSFSHLISSLEQPKLIDSNPAPGPQVRDLIYPVPQQFPPYIIATAQELLHFPNSAPETLKDFLTWQCFEEIRQGEKILYYQRTQGKKHALAVEAALDLSSIEFRFYNKDVIEGPFICVKPGAKLSQGRYEKGSCKGTVEIYDLEGNKTTEFYEQGKGKKVYESDGEILNFSTKDGREIIERTNHAFSSIHVRQDAKRCRTDICWEFPFKNNRTLDQFLGLITKKNLSTAHSNKRGMFFQPPRVDSFFIPEIQEIANEIFAKPRQETCNLLMKLIIRVPGWTGPISLPEYVAFSHSTLNVSFKYKYDFSEISFAKQGLSSPLTFYQMIIRPEVQMEMGNYVNNKPHGSMRTIYSNQMIIDACYQQGVLHGLAALWCKTYTTFGDYESGFQHNIWNTFFLSGACRVQKYDRGNLCEEKITWGAIEKLLIKSEFCLKKNHMISLVYYTIPDPSFLNKSLKQCVKNAVEEIEDIIQP